MSLAIELEEYIRAGFIGIWVKTHEQDEAIQDMKEMCKQRPKQDWTMCTWDLQNKLLGPDNIARSAVSLNPQNDFAKPGVLFRNIPDLAQAGGKQVTLFVLRNFHMKDLIDNPLYMQSIQNLIATGKGVEEFRYYLVFMAPTSRINSDMEKHLVIVNHELPDKDTLWNIATEIAGASEDCPMPEDEESKLLIQEAASGLTRYEAEGAFSLSIIRTRGTHKRIDPKIVWGVKAQSLRKRGLLEIYEGDASFDKMGGMDYFRDFTGRLLRKRTTDSLLYPKGLMLLGVPGSGKTQAVRALGNETGRPVLHMRMGSLRSKFQGESDSNLESALEIADVMAPCILFIDEVEKALSGVGSGGASDGGTGERMFGRLLEWQNDHKSDVFFACTCNDISRIMETNPEFVRAERFDGMFFFNVPLEEERAAIWRIYLEMFGYPKMRTDELVARSQMWTGAEIRSCCRLAKITEEPLVEVMKTIVPIATTADSTLTSLRRWAAGKCRSVNVPGLFKYTEKQTEKRVEVKNKAGLRRKLDTH